MRVLHVSPTYFGDLSFVGGGERYALELARAMSDEGDVTFLSFADQPMSSREGSLGIEHLQKKPVLMNHPIYTNPLSGSFFKWVRWADVIHCHQVRTHITDFAIVVGKLLGKRVFVTDLGGGHKYALSAYLPLLKKTDAFLLISEYSRKLWRKSPANSRPRSLEVIYGGVDTSKFAPGDTTRSRSALYVGRLMPHKGIDYLIEAMHGRLSLDIVGRAYHPEYFELLKSKSLDKSVTFHTAVDDESLVRKYREALVTVLPSVYDNCYGEHTEVPELLGLVALESLACGTPVILSNVASLPEIVEDGVTGFLVPPNDSGAIRARLEYLHENPEVAEEMGRRGREKVLREFTWKRVADRCFDAYRNNN
jgi:alpha-maltose-1-phosphate synthase